MPTAVLASEPGHSRHQREKFMWITPDRLVYVGLLGQPTVRTVGALQLYVASEGELKIQIAGGEWQTAEMAVVYPYVSHQIEAEARLIYSISIEPEGGCRS